ncbi:formimidoyltransferase-cyclodeaminase-like isoform X2 [Pollicipes pollicipes]|uniref:formimidoyltransferase-cyclodeaminase-like isoform X1 n=1 Tax=Pollicipes pollicipes TaxID=41117 RepID=UPI0018852EEA|nr:formimidoyltransferase-cyclodeaminase-like isoform X1 [Pollicipes pollicipes]XP_037075724.1 formimidoyltransferase-cyclodeaminase-like isoform X2 [Pollicipes pollicipes]
MAQHSGEHPRMGALDVCPFIPVRGVTEQECIQCSKRFGERLAQELGVPVFLYGAASSRDYRRTMPQIRAGEYEGLRERLAEARWTPDFGPAEFVPGWGATVTGVRKFLIAYNVNVLGTKEQAHRIALNIREGGRGADAPGRLQCCQAIGWYLEEADLAQVSINLTDYDVTPIHVAFEECRTDAEALRLAVAGSEVVGLLPLAALLQAADHYIQKESLFILEERQKVRLAIDRLGLSSIAPFDPDQRIIEYRLPAPAAGRLAALPVSQFVRQVAARSAAPGGGSVAALCAAVGAGLASMVGKMTYGKRQWEHLDTEMRRLIPVFHNIVDGLVAAIDDDTSAFNDYMAALKLARSTPEEATARAAAMQAGLRSAVAVPLGLMRRIQQLWQPLAELAPLGNIATKSDLQVAVRCLETASWGALHNVAINLDDVEDAQFRQQTLQEAEQLASEATSNSRQLLQVLEARRQ